MTKEIRTTVILIPSENKHIKNIISGDIFEGNVYLGCNDSTDRYTEVDEEEYQNYLEFGNGDDATS